MPEILIGTTVLAVAPVDEVARAVGRTLEADHRARATALLALSDGLDAPTAKRFVGALADVDVDRVIEALDPDIVEERSLGGGLPLQSAWPASTEFLEGSYWRMP